MRDIRDAYQLNESRACGLVGITRWINRYQSRRDPQEALRMRLRELAGTRTRYGYRRLTVMLRREGWKVNTKRVYRIYREENLGVGTTQRKKRGAHLRVPLPAPVRVNQRWSMDFVSDRLADGRWFRILTVVDQYSRECLCAWADRSQTGEKVVIQMKRLASLHSAPESITTDNELNASLFLCDRRRFGAQFATRAHRVNRRYRIGRRSGLPRTKGPCSP